MKSNETTSSIPKEIEKEIDSLLSALAKFPPQKSWREIRQEKYDYMVASHNASGKL